MRKVPRVLVAKDPAIKKALVKAAVDTERQVIDPFLEWKRYSLGTKNKDLKKGADGSLTLYGGAKSPGAEKESNWVPAPNGHFSLYIPAYWG